MCVHETLQELHRDISRLVQLAHPNETSSFFFTHIGVTSFIAALNDSDLEFEILKLESQTLPDAVSHAIRLESLAESVRARSHAAVDKAGGRVQRQRSILAITDENKDKDKDADLQQRVAQLEQQLKQATQGGARPAQSSSKKSNSRRSQGRRPADQNSVAAAQKTSLILRRIRATTAMNMAIGTGIVPNARIGPGRKQMFNLS